MIWGADMLLIGMPNAVAEIENDVHFFLHSWMNGQNGVAYTPWGLAWTSGGAPIRNVANAGVHPTTSPPPPPLSPPPPSPPADCCVKDGFGIADAPHNPDVPFCTGLTLPASFTCQRIQRPSSALNCASVIPKQVWQLTCALLT